MSQPLPFDKNKFERNVCTEDILNTPDNSDIGFLLEVDLRYHDIIRQKTKHFLFAPENKNISSDVFHNHMKKKKPKKL